MGTIDQQFIKERAGKKFVLFAGVLDLAHSEGLKAIRTELIQIPNADNGYCAIVQATVETAKGVFQGIGDASPANCSSMVANALIRMAETRAKARALKDAVNIGMTSMEEMHDDDESGGGGYGGGRGSSRRTPPARTGQASGQAAPPPQAAKPPLSVVSGGDLATLEQRTAIVALCARMGLNADHESALAFQGCAVEALTGPQAVELITSLNRRAKAARAG